MLTPQCSRHQPHPTWISETGPRCPTCGVGLAGQPVPDEPPQVRSFAFYQKRAGATSSQAGTRTPSRLCMAVVGLCGEAGEFLDALKKREFAGHGDFEIAAKELGDCLWYVAEAATALDTTLEAVAASSLDRPWGEMFPADAPLPCSAEMVAGLELCDRANAMMIHAANDRFDPGPEYAPSLALTLGDVLRGIARAATTCGIELPAVATANVAKLWMRYRRNADHKFSSEASQQRVDAASPSPSPEATTPTTPSKSLVDVPVRILLDGFSVKPCGDLYTHQIPESQWLFTLAGPENITFYCGSAWRVATTRAALAAYLIDLAGRLNDAAIHLVRKLGDAASSSPEPTP